MKTCALFISTLLFTLASQAQSPVQWNFSVVKKQNSVYEVRLRAEMPPGWHLYSQLTPAGGPMPTSITFQNNPLVQLVGTVSEQGRLEQQFEEVFNVHTRFYSGKVVFVQVLRLKAAAKTAISGTVEYMACTNEMCLPPTRQKFTIPLR